MAPRVPSPVLKAQRKDMQHKNSRSKVLLDLSDLLHFPVLGGDSLSREIRFLVSYFSFSKMGLSLFCFHNALYCSYRLNDYILTTNSESDPQPDCATLESVRLALTLKELKEQLAPCFWLSIPWGVKIYKA